MVVMKVATPTTGTAGAATKRGIRRLFEWTHCGGSDNSRSRATVLRLISGFSASRFWTGPPMEAPMDLTQISAAVKPLRIVCHLLGTVSATLTRFWSGSRECSMISR